jgi:hypothetical protein
MYITILTDTRLLHLCHPGAISYSATVAGHIATDLTMSPMDPYKPLPSDLIIMLGVDIYNQDFMDTVTMGGKIPYALLLPYDYSAYYSVPAISGASFLISTSAAHTTSIKVISDKRVLVFGPVVTPITVSSPHKLVVNSIKDYVVATPGDDPMGIDQCTDYVEYQENTAIRVPYPIELAGRVSIYSKYIKSVHIPSRKDYLCTYAMEALLCGCDLHTTEDSLAIVQRPILSACKHSTYKQIGFEEYLFYNISTSREKLANAIDRMHKAFWVEVDKLNIGG